MKIESFEVQLMRQVDAMIAASAGNNSVAAVNLAMVLYTMIDKKFASNESHITTSALLLKLAALDFVGHMSCLKNSEDTTWTA